MVPQAPKKKNNNIRVSRLSKQIVLLQVGGPHPVRERPARTKRPETPSTSWSQDISLLPLNSN